MMTDDIVTSIEMSVCLRDLWPLAVCNVADPGAAELTVSLCGYKLQLNDVMSVSSSAQSVISAA